MKRRYLETMLCILETAQADPELMAKLVYALQEDGSRYPEKDIQHLSEEIGDRLAVFA